MNRKSVFYKIVFTVIGMLLLQVSFGQENYLKGYIVEKTGDTIPGFIDYRNWDRNPDKISFKDGLNSAITNYTPSMIKAFGVKDEIYISAEVMVETSSDILKDLENNANLHLKTFTVFLQTMVTGPKSLYYYKNKSGKEQFYIRQDSDFELLLHKRYLNQQDDGEVLTESNKYFGQLALYLSDCPQIQTLLKTVEYSKPKLEKLFQEYYGAKHSRMTFQKKTEKSLFEFGITGGVASTNLKLKPVTDLYYYLKNVKYSPSTNLIPGLFLNIVLPRNQGKFCIYNEINYSSFHTSGQYYESSPNNPDLNNRLVTTQFDYTYLKMSNMIRYQYALEHMKIFVNGGISNGCVLSNKIYRKDVIKFYESLTTKEYHSLPDINRTYVQGLVVGIGTTFKRYSLEFRYDVTNGMSDTNSLSSYVKSCIFFIGLRF
ncbi:MAG: outer membrane beta-barrel protein [Bacteroidota bacterium]|nr:outer membrane beta-barrel protein [Bacteroidota bacterium]